MSESSNAPASLIPVPQSPAPEVPSTVPRRQIEIQIDGKAISVPEDATILAAAQLLAIDTPTLCFLDNLTPVNVCRVCVVELEGSRALVPACSRKVEPGMRISTDSERVRLSRRLVLEFLASSVDVSTAPSLQRYVQRYGADPQRFGAAATHAAEPVKIDNELYVRDYAKCILCYKCVEACGVDAQNTFAISVAGRGFSAHIAAEFDVPLPDSACVYCGNCIGVCPTGALMFKTEYDMRKVGTWQEAQPGSHGHNLPVLRRGVHADCSRAGWENSRRHFAARSFGNERPSVYQRTIRLAVCADSRERARRNSSSHFFF